MRVAGFGIFAGACGQACRHRTIAQPYAALFLMALLLLGGCALPGMEPAQLASHTPTATATPILWRGAPHRLPTGWKVDYATHFTLAVPADWQVDERVELDSTWASPHPTYLLFSSQDHSAASGVVYEYDGLTPAQVHDEFCTPTADDTMLTIGDLPMRFSVGYGPRNMGLSYDSGEYNWIFISTYGTVYWFNFEVDRVFPDGPITQLDRAVVETFAPQYATWGCA